MQQEDKKVLHLNKNLGILVRKLRKELTKKSIYKLSGEYGIDRGNFCRLENGKIGSKFSTVWKISEALGMKCSDLVKLLEDELGDDFKLIDE